MLYAWWIGTISFEEFLLPSPREKFLVYVRGQLEIGANTGYRHYQVIICLSTKQRLSFITKRFCGYWEPTRSKAAREYVWKSETSVPDTQFEFGELPMRRNTKTDWDAVYHAACKQSLESIPKDVYIRHYFSLRKISEENSKATPVDRVVYVYWGKTGTGKTQKAWQDAGYDAYPKDPNTKWWDGYSNQENVIIDEFRGAISISHVLRWFDRYPVLVERKGGTLVFNASRIWITSNLDPRLWYPDIDEETKLALLRRLNITHFNYSVFYWLLRAATRKPSNTPK